MAAWVSPCAKSPYFGYDTGIEIGDPRRRREERLPEQELLPRRGDTVGAVTNLFTPQSDWIAYHTTVSTSDDQIALSPGYLTRDWHANGRHYFSYDMGNVKTLDFYAYVSARHDVNSSYFWAVHAACSCYDEPNNPMTFPAPVPEIPAANVDKAAAYYVNTLGFTFDWGDDQRLTSYSDRMVTSRAHGATGLPCHSARPIVSAAASDRRSPQRTRMAGTSYSENFTWLSEIRRSMSVKGIR